MLIIANNKIKVFKIEEISAKVECIASNNKMESGTYIYEANVITRNCQNKLQAADYS